MDTAKSLMTSLFGGNAHLQTCEICGNEYDKCIEVRLAGETHVFDCFECAIHALAPRCAHCGCQIIGHGMEANDVYYCCAHCASQHDVHLEDRLVAEKSSV